MSDLSTTPTPTLFKQWRHQGDAAAGQAMAQRFSDWYYAITTCRLGDAHGRGPLQRACVRFQQGILSVTTPTELADWSHVLLMEEVKMAGGRIAGGDFPNQLTGGRSPTELLQQVAGRLEPGVVRLLTAAYDSEVPLEEVTALAETMGGYPFAVLHARLAAKRALRDHAGVAFTEVPDSPNLDLAPLPLYEAGRMPREAEETGFEKWMLTDMGLCKDIAEFGVFAQAMRAGALRAAVAKSSAAPAVKSASKGAELAAAGSEEAAAEAAPPGMAGVAIPLVITILIGLVGLLVLLAGGAYLFLLR
ncbi:hypothetical protein LBMAG42_49050 [Deltaproteobacteria bacterium]|nr:hypothetical protein LBMAG42_49050 [Deltaproteobacteria bacterium]